MGFNQQEMKNYSRPLDDLNNLLYFHGRDIITLINCIKILLWNMTWLIQAYQYIYTTEIMIKYTSLLGESIMICSKMQPCVNQLII